MIYYYIYYIFYRISKKNKSIFPDEFVAGVCVIALNIWLLMSLANEFYFFTNIRLMPRSFASPVAIIVLGLVVISNWFLFENKDRWKMLLEKIESSSDRKRNVSIAWGIIIAVIINYWVVSLYLLSVKG